jgi:hypothetical protein
MQDADEQLIRSAAFACKGCSSVTYVRMEANRRGGVVHTVHCGHLALGMGDWGLGKGELNGTATKRGQVQRVTSVQEQGRLVCG